MEFYPDNIFDANNNAEKEVWQQVKSAFRDDSGEAFHCYQLFDRYGNLEREIDILIVHRQLGLWVIECKGCYINDIEAIKGAEWKMKNWYEDRIKPVNQAQYQMFALKNHLRKQLDFCASLNLNFRVVIPFISQEQWQNKGFHNLPNIQGVVLTREDLKPYTLKHNFTQSVQSRQRNLTDEQWRSLMCLFGGTNQTPVDKASFSISKDISVEKEKTHKIDDSKTPRPVCKIIKLPRYKFPINSFPGICDYQTNNVANKILDSIYQPEFELEELLTDEEEDLLIIDEGEDEFLEVPLDEEDGYFGRSANSHHWKQTQKKHYTEDSIRLYLEEIGRIRLLRADEEIELARKIVDLMELERVRERLCEQLDRDPWDSEWAKAVQLPLPAFRYRLHVGRRAKDKIVISNLRLVVSIAKKYMNRGLCFQDLVQEGSLGLIRAAEKFDHEKGYKFSTYATWWIRQAITRAIAEQSRTIHLPVHLYETISRIKKTTKLLSQEMGRKPTEEEIATRMEMTIEKLRFIAKSAQLPISLETPIGKEEDSQLGYFIEYDGETPEEQVYKNTLREDLEKVLESLSSRECDVIKLRYGFDNGHMKTLEEIGKIFNSTRERIRQIEAKALRKLRHPNRNSILKDYIRGCQPHDLQQKKYKQQSQGNQNYTGKTKNAPNYVQKGLICYRDRDFLGAIENFTQALELNPNNAQLHYQRGLANTKGEFQKEAIEDFTQAINLNPQYIDAYYQRGHVHYSLGDNLKAIEDYSEIIFLNPNEALAYFYRGFVRSNLGEMQEAIGNYSQALKIKPDLAEAYFHRGVAYYRLKDLHRAIEDYNYTLQIYPNFAEAYSRRGLAHYCLGNYQVALEDYSQAVQINCEDTLTYYYRGLVHENLSDYIKALKDYNQVLKINPAFTEAYYNRGSVHYNLGNYQQALEDLNQLLRINPNNSQAYNKRSSIRAALKDYQGAMEDLKNAS
ncbi:RNA polymerase sigma factor RpoD [Nostoc sp. 'Lobaria pulmonaria (5183) cyanobiont']|nr:RNA polymerase sigma factor RpoD [Nostoc sp. 'Lobaria pulmonaria (5183) cyanobiont']